MPHVALMSDGPIARSERVSLRPTREADLDFVLRTERDPENAAFIMQWSPEQHRDTMADPGAAHWIIEANEDARPVGYLIMLGVGGPHGSVEFRRIALAERDRGYGREALRLLKQAAFEKLGAHRLWLDVMEHNERARHLYASEGFVAEGVLRDAVRAGERWASLVIMSMLAGEYRRS